MTDSVTAAALAAAVAAIGGTQRDGQALMAEAVSSAIAAGEHLLVQAGTGTGKSLGYLIPALVRLTEHPDERVVVATATLALQAQLATKDIPVAIEAVGEVTQQRPVAAVLKGRSNYACLLKVREGVGEEQDSLLGGAEVVTAMRASNADATSVVGAEVVALREWAEREAAAGGVADRDDAPSHGPQAWAQVSVPVRECLGAQNCRFGDVCLVEKSRERARQANLVVTNHSLLAIDAMHGGTALPAHEFVIIDEAHELTARVTSAASLELSPQMLERAGKRCLSWLDDELALEFLETGELLRRALDEAEVAQVKDPDSEVVAVVAQIRDTTRKVVSVLGKGEQPLPVERVQAGAAVAELFDAAEAMAKLGEHDVLWVVERERSGRELRHAPLSVAGLMRARVLEQMPVVLTSATLTVGGDFGVSARSVGLRPDEEVPAGEPSPEPSEDELPWRGVDVGSPFDYERQAILYVAKALERPRREGISEDALDQIVDLVEAAGGHTLGLFASQRSAEVAAAHVRKRLPAMSVFCQGDAHLADLTQRFVADPESCLFGTLSLWQGLDVPGQACELVIIDKIPFPRPDEPLQLARQEAVARAGGNGFMQVAAAHAGLLLAQGSGRLIRRSTDRGVVAVLDPRLVTARYGSYLRASLPDFWTTTDLGVAIGALRRLRSQPSAQPDAASTVTDPTVTDSSA